MKTRKGKGEETKEALVAAVIRLLDGRSVADISVKAIAAEAGVNHGLVHRYFGSKDGLVREAFARTNAEIGREYPERGQTLFTLRLLRERPEIGRILARCCLDGPHDLLRLAAPPLYQLELYLRPIRRALERFGLAGRIDPYVVNAAGAAMLFGWVVFRPLFEHGHRIPPDADEKFAELARLIDSLSDEDDRDATPA